jgi:hypothetical protein
MMVNGSLLGPSSRDRAVVIMIGQGQQRRQYSRVDRDLAAFAQDFAHVI